MLHYRLILVYLLSVTALAAQEIPDITYGRVSDEDRALRQVPGDSTADAYVLYDRLSLGFNYNEQDGPSLAERHHRRVKLLRPSAFDRADVELTFDREFSEISDLEGIIHLPTGGSLPLSPADIHQERVGGTREVIKFTFPRVTEGAIIEYRYVARRKSILIPSTYYFQEDIPVRWAQYDALIPPYYRYVSLTTPRLDVSQTKLTARAWGPRFKVGAYNAGEQKLEHADVLWAMHDLPAFRDQPYSNNVSDYLPKVRLQLQAVQYPGQAEMSIFGDWEETVKELQDRQDFGRYYRNKINYGNLWKAAAPDIEAAATPRAKIEAAYAFINRNISWDGDFALLASESPNRVFQNGTGTTADLNIALLSLLNEAGIEAHPLLVSLRNTGAPIESYPIMEQFNHLLVYTEVDGAPLLLDAGSRDRPAGLPAEEALNHRGWVADKNNPRWVDLEVGTSRQVLMLDVDVAASGEATIAVVSRMQDYFSFAGRRALRGLNDPSQAPLAPGLLRMFPGARITSYAAVDDTDAPLNHLSYEMQATAPVAQPVEDYLYLQPVLIPLIDGELADAETRDLPIDFPYPLQQQYLAKVHLPAGYVLEDAPAPVRLRTADGSLVASYSVQQVSPEVVSIMYSVQLGRTLFTAEEYGDLREMFRRISELQESPLVFKKQL
ncbi:DUF3857 domain-containing protein [Lewinella sp. IMCC34183]|uniref:DUF3857 domain-containing protein n=1 Tax=Lewinella sp. IMCC34183 TaxID=2248762 RepID=UPI000E22AC3D|nr:DUF3857 domain-containing protein [Lewinella sp. IMCC34183]